MDDWLKFGLPVVITVVTVLWTTGGRAALLRRAIAQELEAAEKLPAGPEKDALHEVARARTMVYVGRWVGREPLSVKRGLTLGAVAIAIVAVSLVLSQSLLVKVSPPIFVVVGVLSVALLTIGLSLLAALAVAVVSASTASSRAETAKEQRERAEKFLAERQAEAAGSPPSPLS